MAYNILYSSLITSISHTVVVYIYRRCTHPLHMHLHNVYVIVFVIVHKSVKQIQLNLWGLANSRSQCQDASYVYHIPMRGMSGT